MVFFEIYYLGWMVIIDGKFVDIVCVDYILCVMNVLVGKYIIEMCFDL